MNGVCGGLNARVVRTPEAAHVRDAIAVDDAQGEAGNPLRRHLVLNEALDFREARGRGYAVGSRRSGARLADDVRRAEHERGESDGAEDASAPRVNTEDLSTSCRFAHSRCVRRRSVGSSWRVRLTASPIARVFVQRPRIPDGLQGRGRSAPPRRGETGVEPLAKRVGTIRAVTLAWVQSLIYTGGDRTAPTRGEDHDPRLSRCNRPRSLKFRPLRTSPRARCATASA